MTKTLAIIGASYLQLPLVLKARELGLRSVCFAWEEGAICKEHADKFYPVSVIDKERICELCAEEQIDGVCSIASDIVVPTIAYVAHRLGLPGNSEHSAHISSNKYAMRQALSSVGANCPRYARVRSLDEAKLALPQLRFPLIIKPSDRSGSLGVEKLEDSSRLAAALQLALDSSFCKEALLEEFIEQAREISIESISYADEHYILAITDKVTSGAPHFVELAHHQPSDLPKPLIAEAIRQTRLSLQALDIRNGASHCELMIDPNAQVYITEIGARMGGDFIGSDLVQLSTGYDFLKGVIDVALGYFHPPKISQHKHSGVYFYAPQNLWLKDLLQNPQQHPEIIKCEMHEEKLQELKQSADRAGYCIYQAKQRFQPQETKLCKS